MIRPARPSDLAELVSLDFGSGLEPWTAADFATFLEGPNHLLLVPEGNRILAYAVFQIVPPEGELLRIAVDRWRRREGIASALLGDCLARFEGAGLTSFFLEVREGNHAARQLYLRHGFREIARRVGYYRDPAEDAIVMRLRLGAGKGTR